MGANSAIEWTDHTFNPWHGCTKVSEACRNCYAATLAARFGTEWGPTARRRFFGEKHWAEPLKWNAKAEREGVRRRVFCASMADVFEELPSGHQDRAAMTRARWGLWDLIKQTPSLDWLLLTKRPENVALLAPWVVWPRNDWPANVWIGTTVEDQQSAEKRIPELLRIPAAVRFLSCEPLLEALDTDPWLEHEPRPNGGVEWVIAGGESGHGARPMHPDWVRGLRDQCTSAGVPFFFKQWGEWGLEGPGREAHTLANDGTLYRPWDLAFPDGPRYGEAVRANHEKAHLHMVYRVGKKAAGRTLDGRTWDEVPASPAAL